jgi:hypothetical protein
MRKGGDVPNVKAVERAERRRREARREAWAPALFEWSQRRGMWVLKPETVDAGEPRRKRPARGERVTDEAAPWALKGGSIGGDARVGGAGGRRRTVTCARRCMYNYRRGENARSISRS